MNVVDELLGSLPAPARKHLDPAGPAPARMMAAKGMAPLPPRDMVIVLCGLTLDGDAGLATAARESLRKLPDPIIQPVLQSALPPSALGTLAQELCDDDRLIEPIVVNRATPDLALANVAPRVSERIVEILANNQERCLRSEALVRGIRINPKAIKSTLDRVFDFLVRAGVVYDDVPEFAESLARLTPQEMQQAADKVELPPGALAYLAEDEEEVASTAAHAAAVAEGGEQGAPEGQPEHVGPQVAGGESERERESTERIPMLKLIASLNAAQKVALAVKGNKEARTALIRDSNKVVSCAAIRSPRITEQEVVAAAQSRSISDEVIRIICMSRDMTRSYGVKVALVNNPKTALPVAMRFLPLLRVTDLKTLSRSKNVTSALANQAKRMLRAKSGVK